jgi:hypothetical protein
MACVAAAALLVLKLLTGVPLLLRQQLRVHVGLVPSPAPWEPAAPASGTQGVHVLL